MADKKILKNRLAPQKIYYHPKSLAQYKTSGFTYPVHAVLGLVNFCNHRCTKCMFSENVYLQDKKAQTIDKDRLIRFLEEASAKGLKAVTIAGMGEPMLHPDSADIIRGIKALGVDVGVITNGQRMSDELIEAITECATWIRVSLDAAEDDTYKLLRGESADVVKVFDNIDRLVKAKEGNTFPTVGVQFDTSDQNYLEMKKFAEMMIQLEVDYIGFRPVYDGEGTPDSYSNSLTYEDIIPYLDEVEKQSSEKTKVYAKKEYFYNLWGSDSGFNGGDYYKVCIGHYFVTSLMADGNIYLCGNMTGLDEYVIGNIYESTLDEIWLSDQHKRVIDSIDLYGTCPARCCIDPLNKVLWDIFNPSDDAHPNFI